MFLEIRMSFCVKLIIFLSSFFVQGAAIDRILGEIVHNNDVKTPIDYVLCMGHFLSKVCLLCYLGLILN